MKIISIGRLAVAAAAVAAIAVATDAGARTQVVTFDHLVATATVGPQLLANDTLFVNTFVANEFGALNQTVTFTVGLGVGNVVGNGAWEITTASGPGPRLLGLDITVFDLFNNVVISDSNVATNNGFATSSFASTIGPGTYRLVATGTGERESSLDISLAFTSLVPEPSALAMAIGGLAALGFLARRRARED